MTVSTPLWLSPDRTIDVVPPRLSSPSTRSAAELEDVIRQFHVELSPRYAVSDINQDGIRETWCNLYVSDVTRAMGCEVPRRVLGRYQRANDMVHWLTQQGFTQGWRRATQAEARRLADLGRPVVAGWDSLTSAPGHVAIVLPRRAGTQRPTTEVTQAGAQNWGRVDLGLAFGKHRLSAVQFFSHP